MNKLLVVVDYQNDFVSGSLGFDKAKELDKGITKKFLEALDNKNNVLITLDTHQENYLSTQEGKKLPIEHCILNTDGHNLYGDFGKAVQFIYDTSEKASYIQKVSKDTFGMLYFPHYTFSKPKEIEIVGVVTNICVISVAVSLKNKFPESEIIIDASLCASFDDELHEKALDVMESLQMKIINRGDK